MTVEWAAVSAIVALCLLVGAVAGWFTRRGFADAQAKSAEALAQACLAKIELLSSSLHQHEINDAASFAEIKTLVSEAHRSQVAIETRLVTALGDLGERIERLTERIDRRLDREP